MLNALTSFDSKALDLDCAAAAREIEDAIQRIVAHDLRRQGIVLGVSGGIDSSVCATLAVRALGPERVLCILMPEKENSPKSTRLGTLLCEHLGVTPVMENITGPLEALGCYERRDNAIRRLFPEFGAGWKQKIGLAGNLLDADRVNYFTLTVESPDGERQTSRMPVDVYLDVVAATNLKQRMRKTVEYTHADRLNYAVLGTPNRLEYELGFFGRGGDGLADLKPIAHLYKSQVYQMAAYLGLPAEIQAQSPSTDTSPALSMRPVPWNEVILFLRNRKATPSTLDLTVASLCAIMAGRSSSGALTFTPSFARPYPASSNISEA